MIQPNVCDGPYPVERYSESLVDNLSAAAAGRVALHVFTDYEGAVLVGFVGMPTTMLDEEVRAALWPAPEAAQMHHVGRGGAAPTLVAASLHAAIQARKPRE